MTIESLDLTSSGNFPFAAELIPVVEGLEGFRKFSEQYNDYQFCPYIADKTDEEWRISTSRRYMNQTLPGFLYVPVNVTSGDEKGLYDFIDYANQEPFIAAVNITKPHKSTPVLKRYFYGSEAVDHNVDTLIKSNEDGILHPYDLNSVAFANWFEEEVQTFEGMHIVLVGVGGVGEPIAKQIDKKRPERITLVDTRDRGDLSAQLMSSSAYNEHLADVQTQDNKTIVINASGKDGISDDTGLMDFIRQTKPGIFVDLRPQLLIPIVEEAKTLGWQSYTGNGMNARNDYELLTGIMNFVGTPQESRLSFEEFCTKVALNS